MRVLVGVGEGGLFGLARWVVSRVCVACFVWYSAGVSLLVSDSVFRIWFLDASAFRVVPDAGGVSGGG